MKVKHIVEAFKLLGIDFCSVCNKPYYKGNNSDVLYLNNNIIVCVEPKLTCISKLLTTEDKVALNFAKGIANWIIDSKIYSSSNGRRALLWRLINEELLCSKQQLAVELLKARTICLLQDKLLPGHSPRQLLQLCGWDVSHEELEKIILQYNKEVALIKEN